MVQIKKSLEHHGHLEARPFSSSDWKDLLEEMSIRSTEGNGHSTKFDQTLDPRINFPLGLITTSRDVPLAGRLLRCRSWMR